MKEPSRSINEPRFGQQSNYKDAKRGSPSQSPPRIFRVRGENRGILDWISPAVSASQRCAGLKSWGCPPLMD